MRKLKEGERTWIQADLVHNRYASFLDLCFQLLHCGRNIAGCDDVFLLADCGFDDSGVIGVRNQGNNDVMFLDLLVQSCFVVDIERDCGGILDARS